MKVLKVTSAGTILPLTMFCLKPVAGWIEYEERTALLRRAADKFKNINQAAPFDQTNKEALE